MWQFVLLWACTLPHGAHTSLIHIAGQYRDCHRLSNVPAEYPSQGTRTRGACGDLHYQMPACTGQQRCHLLMLSWQSAVFPVVCMRLWSQGNQAMHEDLMEQKYVGSAEFNLAEAVYARSSPKNHGWLKKKLENIKRTRFSLRQNGSGKKSQHLSEIASTVTTCQCKWWRLRWNRHWFETNARYNFPVL